MYILVPIVSGCRRERSSIRYPEIQRAQTNPTPIRVLLGIGSCNQADKTVLPNVAAARASTVFPLWRRHPSSL